MALNWGHKITIVLILFGALMFTLVYKSIKTDFQLVSKDYYKDELQYQQVIDGSNNANALTTELMLVQTDKGISVQFPQEMKGRVLQGEIWFYCSYDERKDLRLKIDATNEAVQLIESSRLAAATYSVKTTWKADDTPYYNEQSFTVK
ncbi:MAG TPA: FixH family protein [Lacibacter sp.]|nr:FixH family protein [Lacibacter sp.]